ncbi:hypothetical protein ACJX0J_020340, partial [Zea mays]
GSFAIHGSCRILENEQENDRCSALCYIIPKYKEQFFSVRKEQDVGDIFTFQYKVATMNLHDLVIVHIIVKNIIIEEIVILFIISSWNKIIEDAIDLREYLKIEAFHVIFKFTQHTMCFNDYFIIRELLIIIPIFDKMRVQENLLRILTFHIFYNFIRKAVDWGMDGMIGATELQQDELKIFTATKDECLTLKGILHGFVGSLL